MSLTFDDGERRKRKSGVEIGSLGRGRVPSLGMDGSCGIQHMQEWVLVWQIAPMTMFGSPGMSAGLQYDEFGVKQRGWYGQ